MLKGTVRAGKVDCQAHYQTCQSAGITAYPTVRFYPYLGTPRVRAISLGMNVKKKKKNTSMLMLISYRFSSCMLALS